MARDLHRQVHSVCPNGAANWADCDRVADDRYQDWQAMQQVLLAFMILRSGEEAKIKRMKRDGQFGALLRYMAEDAPDILNDEGNPAATPWANRLRAACARAVAGDLPNYNLYGLRRREIATQT